MIEVFGVELNLLDHDGTDLKRKKQISLKFKS